MVEADLLGTSGGSEEHGGYGERRWRRRAPLGRMQGESRGGNGVQGKRGRAGRLRAAAWRLHAWIGSKGEASSAKQEVAGVDARHASPLLVLLAEEEEDKGGGGGLGRLGELGRLWWLRG